MAKSRKKHSIKPSSPAVPSNTKDFPAWIGAVVLVLAGFLVYANGLHGQFIFDDRQILEKSSLHHLWPLTDVVKGSNRPVFDLSLAFSYTVFGLDPFGYHVFNVCVHVISAVVLYFLIRRTLETSGVLAGYRERAGGIAFAIALLWELHPLQTSAVTYITQRAESLMGLFFLSSFLCVAAGHSSGKRKLWDVLSIVLAALSVGTKEIGVMIAPLMLFYERIFYFSSFRELWNKRKNYYFALFSTWLIPAYLLSTTQSHSVSAGFGIPVLGPWEYGRTQPGVVLHYLRLVFWPVGLCLDYQWPIAVKMEEIALPFLGIIVLLGTTAYLLKRKPALGFLGVWFFGILGITSSFFPIQDIAFEHRMYLPSIAVIAAVILGADHFLRRGLGAGAWRKAAVILLTAVAIALGWLTYERNKDYKDALTMWRDIVEKRPKNVRAKSDLGLALALSGQYDLAEKYLREALGMLPEFDKALNNLGLVYFNKGEFKRAKEYFERAVKANPKYADAYGNLGLTLVSLGLQEEGTEYFLKAVTIDPDNADNFNNLGVAYLQAGKFREAEEALQKAIRLRPHLEKPYNNLAMLAMREEDYAKAEKYLLAALQIDPNYARALNNYGVVLHATGRLRQARQVLERAVALDPSYRDTIENLQRIKSELKE